jgi:carbonic anhydrase/acetyltransferase-like protein (isoleucine patch superfamily)
MNLLQKNVLGIMKNIIKRIAWKILLRKNIKDEHLSFHPLSKVKISKTVSLLNCNIKVGQYSELTIDDDVIFMGELIIGENCRVNIGKNCRLSNISLNIKNNGELIMLSNCIFDAPEKYRNSIDIDNGKMNLMENVCLQADVLVRFGGELRIDKFSSINYNSEIRCEERITIGEYCLMSYEVCIYDTNTHSVDWQERRERIPFRASEIKRPMTKPVFIGNDVWIGKGATILKGAEIGNKSIIGIRTIVPSGKYGDNSKIVMPKPMHLI